MMKRKRNHVLFFGKEILSKILALPFGNLHRNLYTRDSWYVEIALQELLQFHKESGFAFQQISNLEEKMMEMLPNCFTWMKVKKYLDFEEILKEQFQDQVSITLSTPNCLEIMKKASIREERFKIL